MRTLESVSQRTLRRRKGRYALTALGIALGVGIVLAVLMTSAATNRAFDRFVAGFTGTADVVVTPTGTFDAALPPAVIDGVRADPDVELAVERFSFRSSRELRGESADFSQFLDVSGFDFAAAARVHRFVVADGRLPQTAAVPEVVVTPVVGGEVGDEITLATTTGRREVRVVGVLAEEGAALANGGRVVYTTIETARGLQGAAADAVWSLDVVLADGVDAGEWIDARQASLTEGAILQRSSETAGFFREFLTSVQGALTITAAIALFVGAFLIFLTFSVSVAERTRFFGTLRALGAQPAQIRRLVIGEAALLGFVSALGGLVLGYVIASVSLGLVDALLDIGPVSLEDPEMAIVVSLLLGVGTSMVAAYVPARRAASMSPVAAMRDQAFDQKDRVRVAPRVAVLVVGVVLSVGSGWVLVQTLGALLIMLGGVLVVPILLRPLARFLGRVTARIGRGLGVIAVAHLVKERSRSAYTLALLMSVMAATIAIGASNLSMAESLDEVVERQFGSDLQVGAPNTFDPEVGTELASMDGVASVSELRFGATQLERGDVSQAAFMVVVDPASYFELSSFPWLEGDDETVAAALARGGSVVLADPIARDLGVEVGEEVDLRTTEGLAPFRLVGTYTVLGFNEGAVVGIGDADRLLGAARPMGYLVDVDDEVPVDRVRASIQERLADRYDFEIETAADIKEFAQSQLTGFFGIGYAVLLVSILIGILGLANTLIVSIIQRTREIGILRSTGAQRRQLRAMVLAEAATLVLVAWLLALPLGWLLTRVTIQAFAASLGFTIDFLWPWGLIPPLFALALFAGAVASVGPARRAARLDPVVALRFD